MEEWGIDDMVRYLNCISLGHLCSAIKDNGIDGRFLLQLSLTDMSAIGVGPLQWKKILAYLPQ